MDEKYVRTLVQTNENDAFVKVARDYTNDVVLALAREIERLRAEREWQPIETAPRDGTRILLGRFVKYCKQNRNGYMACDFWHEKERGERLDGFGSFNSKYWPPTHWQPLPSAPKLEDE